HLTACQGKSRSRLFTGLGTLIALQGWLPALLDNGDQVRSEFIAPFRFLERRREKRDEFAIVQLPGSRRPRGRAVLRLVEIASVHRYPALGAEAAPRRVVFSCLCLESLWSFRTRTFYDQSGCGAKRRLPVRLARYGTMLVPDTCGPARVPLPRAPHNRQKKF